MPHLDVSGAVCPLQSSLGAKRLTKQNHSTALLNTDRQGELLTKHLLTKIPFLHNLPTHPKKFNLAECTGDGQK